MKNLISVVFALNALVAMAVVWYALWTVFGPMMLGFWALGAVTQGVMYLGNPHHKWFDSVKALNLGINLGITLVAVFALWTILGWWTPALGAAFVAVTLLHNWAQRVPPFTPTYGATFQWETLTVK